MDGKPYIRRTALSPFLSLSLSLFLSFFLAATSIADTTYRWADDNGNPVLSDRPPAAGTPFTEIGVNALRENGHGPMARRPAIKHRNENRALHPKPYIAGW